MVNVSVGLTERVMSLQALSCRALVQESSVFRQLLSEAKQMRGKVLPVCFSCHVEWHLMTHSQLDKRGDSSCCLLQTQQICLKRCIR